MMTKKQSLLPFIIWSFIIVAACIFYGVGISHESIWFDEAYSAEMADHPFAKILSLTSYDNHPPLYYLLLRMFRLLLGNSAWALGLNPTFDQTKFLFNEPEKEITLELYYPPFTELLQGN